MLTREQFQTIYDQEPDALFALFTTMQEQIEALTAEVKTLRDRLSKDSHNSSKPPSSDGLGRKPVSLRPKTGKKPGGQPGHRGRTLSFCETPDEVVVHTPEACACCGKGLAAVETHATKRRQVVELPPLSLVTTEHQAHEKVCPDCGHHTVADFPEEASQSVQYGPRLKALGVYLLDFHLVPYHRLAGLFADLFGASVSPGTLFTCQQAASTRLSAAVCSLRQQVASSPVAHFDETGIRLGGKLRWLHVASTQQMTYYTWHKQRGKGGMDAAGVLPAFTGIAVHDGWASYHSYPCAHALCNAHHLRELTGLYEQDAQDWAKTMSQLLVEGKKAVEKAKQQGQTGLTPAQNADFLARYHQLLQAGFANNPASEPTGKRGRPKQSRAYNLLDRLHRFARETLRFLSDFRVPFDNNLAERDIRMVKVEQKVSGGFRSEEGAEAFCRIRSYISTLRKQGQPVLSALEHVFAGKPLNLLQG